MGKFKVVDNLTEVQAICHAVGYDEESRKLDDINILIVSQDFGGAYLSVLGLPHLQGTVNLTRLL